MDEHGGAMKPHTVLGAGMRVLVPVDLEEDDSSAIAVAYRLASGGGAVHLLNVWKRPSIPGPLYAHYSPGPFPTQRQQSDERRERERRLLRRAPAGREALGAATEVHVLEDVGLTSATSRLAEELDVDVVCVLAHRKLSSPGRCGRQARKILARCPRPVLVVRPGETRGRRTSGPTASPHLGAPGGSLPGG